MTDADLNRIAAEALSSSRQEWIQNLKIECLDESLKISGESTYPMPLVGTVSLAFDLICRIQPSQDGRELEIQIEQVNAAKVPAMMVNHIIPFLLGKLSGKPGLRVRERSIIISPLDLLTQKGFQIEGVLQSVVIHPGEMTIEC